MRFYFKETCYRPEMQIYHRVMKTLTLNTSRANQSLLARRRNKNRKSPTPAESHVKSLLDDLGEKYIFEKGLMTEKRFYLVDFYFPKPRKLCLELDGPCHELRKHYDAVRDNFICTKRKMRVLRISNEHALGLNKEKLLALLSLNSRRIPKIKIALA